VSGSKRGRAYKGNAKTATLLPTKATGRDLQLATATIPTSIRTTATETPWHPFIQRLTIRCRSPTKLGNSGSATHCWLKITKN